MADIDNNSENTTSGPASLDEIKAAASGASKPAPRVRKVKPLVEGINAPSSLPASSPAPAPNSAPSLLSETNADEKPTVIPPKVTLTSSERKLVEDPMIPSAPPTSSPSLKAAVSFGSPVKQKIVLPKKSYGHKVVWSSLISLLAVTIVLGLYLLYNNRTTHTNGQLGDLFRKPTTATQTNNSTPKPTPAASSTQATQTAASSSQPSAATTTPPAVVATQLRITNTPTGYLNVRSGPSFNNKIITKVHPGEVYTYDKKQGDWYHITLNDNSTGWVNSQYVQVLK